MNSKHTRGVVATAFVAALCLGGPGAGAPAPAKTDLSGGGGSAGASSLDVGQIVAERKAQMARDYVDHAADRVAAVAAAGPRERC